MGQKNVSYSSKIYFKIYLKCIMTSKQLLSPVRDSDLSYPNGDKSMGISESHYEETRPDVTWSQIIGGSIGNVLEWYDFITFGMLAPQIGYNFFPSDSHNSLLEMLKAYGVFAGGILHITYTLCTKRRFNSHSQYLIRYCSL